jgi:DNA helicase-2/ATP-dependent DNA helicase PcrA
VFSKQYTKKFKKKPENIYKFSGKYDTFFRLYFYSLHPIMSENSPILQGLNPMQKQAASHINGPLLVVAGAGSGKTKTLTVRIAYLLEQGIPAHQILAVTFTNKAAKEMKDRVKNMLGEEVKVPTIGTFHSIGVRILRREMDALGRETSFTILDSADMLSLAKKLLKEKNIDIKIIPPRLLLSQISKWKSTLITTEKAQKSVENRREQILAELYTEYEKYLHENNSVDFDDLLLLPVKIFTKKPEILEKYQNWWKYIMIDEYQDTNLLQYQFAQMVSHHHRNICAIGDSDQSIYKFRGADLSNILNFQSEYSDAKIVKLEQNYRSTKKILQAADAVIKQNSARIDKKMFTENDDGEDVSVFEFGDEREEASGIFQEIAMRMSQGKKLSDMAILYRTNAQSRALEEAAMRSGIPYTIVGGLKFYARAEVKDILSYLRLILNEDDELSLDRIINVPPRKIGKTSVLRLKSFAFENTLSTGQMLRHIGSAEGIPPAAKKAILGFEQIISDLRKDQKTLKLSDFIERVIEKTGYKKHLEKSGEEGQVRLENILELISVAQKYDEVPPERALALFLEEVSLVSDLDEMEETSQKVTLMTLHSSKGLEFPVVFVAGCEENIFPSSRSLNDPDDLEEERRLMYVGLTRGMEKVFVTHAKSRMLYGDFQYNAPSRFIAEMPENICDGNYFAEKSSEQVFEKSYESAPDCGFEVGDLVEHTTKFGLGKITKKEGDILTVHFQTAGIKRLAGSIAPLEKVDPDFY